LKATLGWEAKHSSLDEVISSAWQWKQKHPNGYGGLSTAAAPLANK
jgi:UDP-glucose 4-epimerase